MCQRERIAGAFVWIPVLVCLLSGCMDQSTPQARSPLTGSYSYSAPTGHRTSSGRLVLGDSGFPISLNPLFVSTRLDSELEPILWSAPVVFDQQFHAQPDQLTEVPLPENDDVQDGGKTIIMRLRHNLRWSDGVPLLASDFIYWWQLDQNADTGAATTTGYDQIASMEAPDNFTVILHMKQPFGPYLHYLPFAAPEHAWGKFKPIELQNQSIVFQAPTVTDGPYKLALYVDQQSYTFEPNTYYVSTIFHGPFLAQLIYRSYPDEEALGKAVREGQIDLAEGYTEDSLSSLGQLTGAIHLQTTAAAAYEHLDFNLARPIFQDVRVRQAIQFALDRCGILRDILHMPDCARLLNQVEPPPSPVFDTSIQSVGYNLDESRRLLAAAGWQKGAQGWLEKQGKSFTVHLVTTIHNALRAAVANQIQKNLQMVGIRVEMTYYDLGTFFGLYTRGGVLASGAYDLAMFGYANSAEPDQEYAVFHSSQIPDQNHPGLGNYGRISDPLIDVSLTQGRDDVPFSERQKDYHRFLERLAQEVYLIPLYTAVNILAVSVKLKNILANPNPVANNWNIADWWLAP